MGKRTIDGCAVVVVDAGVLMMEGAVKNSAAQGMGGEHAGDEGFELNIAVIEFGWHRTLELELIGLETTVLSALVL